MAASNYSWSHYSPCKKDKLHSLTLPAWKYHCHPAVSLSICVVVGKTRVYLMSSNIEGLLACSVTHVTCFIVSVFSLEQYVYSGENNRERSF